MSRSSRLALHDDGGAVMRHLALDATLGRRQVLRAAALLAAPALLTGCAGDVQRFASWDLARKAVFELLFGSPRLNSGWTLSQMLQHVAQGIHYSMTGYPELKPAWGWYRATLGAGAFAVFNARGKMSHRLDEPIPGAPALNAELSLKSAVHGLLDTMDSFAAFKGTLAPHYAYGSLGRADYERAHLMHLANHWQALIG